MASNSDEETSETSRTHTDTPTDTIKNQFIETLAKCISAYKGPFDYQDMQMIHRLVIDKYIHHKLAEAGIAPENSEEEISVEEDSEQDLVDKEGYIYTAEGERVGKKNLITGKKEWYRTQ